MSGISKPEQSKDEITNFRQLWLIAISNKTNDSEVWIQKTDFTEMNEKKRRTHGLY
jgi:hypothetical protein